MRQGISTRYIAPGNVRGSRVKAIARKRSNLGAEMSHTESYQHGSSDEEHTRAAKILATKLGWAGLWVAGGKPEEDGNQYVNIGREGAAGGLIEAQRDRYAREFGVEDSDWFYVPIKAA